MRRYPTTRMPYEPIFVKGNTLSIDVAAAKRLILFTGHKDKLAGHNEHALDPRIQTGFGIGINDSAMPFENGVGTIRLLNDPIDNIWLTKIDGSGKNKVLTSGYLQANNHLSVDTTNHTITEEFVVRNNGPGTDVQVIDDCSSVDGWSINGGTGVITTSEGLILFTGTTNDAGSFALQKLNQSIDISNKNFIKIRLKCSLAGNFIARIGSVTDQIKWNTSRKTLQADTYTEFVLPIRAPAGTTGSNPDVTLGTINFSSIPEIVFGIGAASANTTAVLTIDSIIACNGILAQVEIAVPDNLADYSTILKCWDGTAYQTVRTDKLNSAYSNVSTTAANLKLLDDTKFDDCYGSGPGSAVFPKGSSFATVTGSTGTMTYSTNKGTQKRIGYKFLMPPSDNGRTGINQCRLKLVTYYDDINGSTVPDLSGNGNNGTIVGGVTKLNEGGLKFDGSSGYVFFRDISFGDSMEYTIEFIILPTTSSFSTILSQRSASTPVIYYHNAKYIFLYELNGVYKFIECGDITGKRTRITLTFSSDRCVRLYIDGVYRGSTTLDNSSMIFSSIGRRGSINDRFFSGTFYRVEAWKGICNMNEIASGIYNATPVIKYNPTTQNMGSTSYEFSNDTDLGTGLGCMKKPYFAFYDPDGKSVDYYILTKKPRWATYKYDEKGNISNITFQLDPNTRVYRGQLKHVNLTRDSDADMIPDFLDSNEAVSIEHTIGHLNFIK